MENLTRLQTLYLSDNQISDIRFLENLTGLQTLYLNFNQISDIRFLSSLALKGLSKRLNISKNQITDLSPILPLIKKGLPVKWDYWEDGICVAENPFTTPPIEIVKQGNEAILRYFEEV